jgi:hypothetical protein
MRAEEEGVVAAALWVTHSGVIGSVTRVYPGQTKLLLTALRRRGGQACCLRCCERICERNAAQLRRWGFTRRDGWDGRLIMTCAVKTGEAT